MELVNAACSFEPHESFFSLFSDPRSTRLSRLHLREDLVQDQDLEAIRKQVSVATQAPYPTPHTQVCWWVLTVWCHAGPPGPGGTVPDQL